VTRVGWGMCGRSRTQVLRLARVGLSDGWSGVKEGVVPGASGSKEWKLKLGVRVSKIN